MESKDIKEKSMMTSTQVRTAEILHIEDNQAEVYLIQEFFNKGNIKKNIVVKRDGEAAIDFLKTSKIKPDLIILDLNLPRKSGREVLREIKSDADLKHIPVIILTVSLSKEDIMFAYKNYANCYFKKPESIEKFIELNHYIEEIWLSLLLKNK